MTTTEFLASCLLLWNSAACSHSRGSKSDNSSIQRGEKGLLTARCLEIVEGMCCYWAWILSISNIMPNWFFGCMDYVFRFGFLSNILGIQRDSKRLLEDVTSPRRMNPIWKTTNSIGNWFLLIIYLGTTLLPFSAAKNSCDDFHVSSEMLKSCKESAV